MRLVAWFLVLEFLHSVRSEFLDDVSGPTTVPETSSGNSPRTPCKNRKTKNQYSFHGESLKTRVLASSCPSVRPSVRPHETVRLPLDGFFRKLIFKNFLEMYPENSRFVKMWQEYRTLYMKTFWHSWLSRLKLLRLINVSDRICRENQNKHFVFNNFFLFPKSYCLSDKVKNNGTATQAADDNITRRKRFACWITKATGTHSEYIIQSNL
jgi:hypothetical protein